MDSSMSTEAAVQQYLDAVKRHLTHAPSERKDEVLRGLREHVREAIDIRTSGQTATLQDAYAVLAEMDPPETYADDASPVTQEQGPSRKLIALGLICSGLQIVGLGVALAGIPVLGAVAGFAAIVSFFLIWSNRQSPRWLIGLAGAAGLCGLGMIFLEVARAF